MNRRELAYNQRKITNKEKKEVPQKGKVRLFFDRFKGRIMVGAVGLTLIGTAGCSGCNRPAKEYMQKIEGEKEKLSPGEQEKLNEQLIEAVIGGNADEVKKLIERGASVNAKDESETVLGRACDGKHDEIVGILLKNGADVDFREDLWRATPLITASVHKENIKILELLVDAGADIDARDNFGRTALIYAAGFGDAEMVKFLLDNGANPDIMAQGLLVENKETALDLAIYLERTENIEVLKAHEN